MPKNSGATIFKKTLLAMLNRPIQITPPSEVVELDKIPPTFSSEELRVLLNQTSTKNNTSSNLKQHIKQTSTQISSAIKETESYSAMLPEAAKAESIFTASILSPTDMNGSSISVQLENCQLPESVISKITKELNILANNELGLIDRLKPWIGSALYRTGATPVLVVPRSVPRYLAEISAQAEQLKEKSTSRPTTFIAGLESFCNLSKERQQATLDITPIILKPTTTKSNEPALVYGLEHYESLLEHLTEVSVKPVEPVISKNIDPSMDVLLTALRGNVEVSLDLSKIHGSTESAKGFINKKKNEIELSHLVNLGSDKLFNIDFNENSFDIQENDEPVLMRLPTSSVIPIIVPGSPETRLGYYVAVDDSGNPIDDATTTTPAENFALSTKLFENLKTEGTVVFEDLSRTKQSQIASDMFDMVINSTLDRALDALSDQSRQITKNKRLATAIFSKALKKQKVTLVFVPEEYIGYYAFDYRKDGTGKSKLEDASTLVALRTSCIIAKVTALMTNAVDDHKITYSLGDGSIDLTNVEQINDLITRMYVNKYVHTPSHNVLDIMRNLYTNSVTAVPQNFRNLKDFQVNKEITQRNISSVDNELEEMLTRFITMLLGVPAGAIDDVHERDFSRSVATTNLLFANDIRIAQAVVTRITATLLQAYVRHSFKYRKKIMDILEKASDQIKLSETIQMSDLLEYVISRITTTLPRPNVSPDQIRLVEITQHCRTIEEGIDLMLNEDMIATDDAELKSTLNSYKGILKHKAIKSVLLKSGDTTLSELADIDFGNTEFGRMLHQTMLNYNAMIERMSSALKASDQESEESGGGTSRW